MSQLQASALDVVLVKALSKILSAREYEVKACCLEDMASAGAASANATLPDGTRAGTVSLVVSAPHATVVNSVVLMEWLAVNVPSAIEEVTIPERIETRVRPEFIEALTARGLHAYTEDGEEVPGVGTTVTKPYVAARVSQDQIKAIIAAFAKGSLDAGALLALPAGEEL